MPTSEAQPAIVKASLERLRLLDAYGIEADMAIGHSLGELTALAWAGAFSDEDIVDLARQRGAWMGELSGQGAMYALDTDLATARELLADGAGIAALNSPRQVVVSGPHRAVEGVAARAAERGIRTARVPAAGPFHSMVFAPVAERLGHLVRSLSRRPLSRRVVSTVTGDFVAPNADLASLLARQLTSPVLFAEGVGRVAAGADLLIEVGPGGALGHLASFTGVPTASTERLEDGIAEAWRHGSDVNIERWFLDRRYRPISLEVGPRFIVSPTERRDAVSSASPNPLPGLGATSPRTSVDAVRRVIADQTDLPLERLHGEAQMLTDLHLSSITVGRLLSRIAHEIGVPPVPDPTLFANATIDQVAAALESMRGAPIVEEARFPDGISHWVRAFRVVEEPLPVSPTPERSESDARGSWRLIGGRWESAEERIAGLAGDGIVALLATDDETPCIETLLACRDVKDGGRVVIVQKTALGSSFARSFHLERPSVAVRVLTIPSFDEAGAEALIAEIRAPGPFVEASYGPDGVRRVPRLQVAPVPALGLSLDSDDVLLVTGGGRGIGFEAALHAGRVTGTALLLVGRSAVEAVRDNLERCREAGVRARYLSVDVSRTADVASALEGAPISAVFHAAGVNTPALLEALDADAVRRVLAPKVEGLRNVLAAVDRDRLKVLVTFGSVIARTGLKGEAHYGLANEWLARLTADFAAATPRCHTVCVEWSVWAGVGMGEDLDAVNRLKRMGVTALPPADAADFCLRIGGAPMDTRVLVAGRLGNPPTINHRGHDSPLLRFTEDVRVLTPDVELVADTELNANNDPYVDEHRLDGDPVLPAVMAMEALAQGAVVLCGNRPMSMTDVRLKQPIPVGTMRVALLASPSTVEGVVRCADSGFARDHVQARMGFTVSDAPPRVQIPGGHVTLDPAQDLYAPLLFHTGRFRRVRRYRLLEAHRCVAEISASNVPVFSRYLPQQLVLGDAAVRDAAVHALQACIPDARVLPVGIEEASFFAEVGGDCVIVAEERDCAEPAELLFDVDICSLDGAVLERWRSLRLRRVGTRRSAYDLAPALWGAFLERDLAVSAVAGAIGSHEAVQAATGTPGASMRGPNGRPLVTNGYVSVSHDDGICLAVADSRPIGCDIQSLAASGRRSTSPRDNGLVAACADLAGESIDRADVRIWSAREAIKKATGDADVPLQLDKLSGGGRVTFASGAHLIHTFVFRTFLVAIAQARDRR